MAVLIAVTAWPALADSHARIVRLSFLSGDVQIDRNLGNGYEKAILNTPITEGMKLQTSGNSLAEVEFEDGTTVRLTPDSEIEFPRLELTDNGARVTTVQADDGIVYFNVVHKGSDDFQVQFADRTINLTRSAHFRLDINPTDVQVAVFKGKVPVQGPDATLVDVKSHEDVTLYEGGSGKYELAKSYSPDQYDSWDNERLSYQKTYGGRASGYNLPYSYGISDLDYYGSWYSYPGYGTLWRPYGVDYSWDPFYNGGSWAYYPGYGYTFVSSYAWGWMPYRYGAWAFVPGFGWAWQPGNVTVWNPTPRVINPPRGWIPPHPPTVIANSGGTPAPTPAPGPSGPSTLVPRRGGPTAPSTFAERTPRIPESLRTTIPVGSPPAGVSLPPQRGPRWDGRGPRAVAGDGIREPRPMPMPRSAPPPRMSAPAAPRMSAPSPRMSAPAPRMSGPSPRMSAPAPRSGGGGRVPH